MYYDVHILEHGFGSYVRLNMKTYKLEPVNYIIPPRNNFGCFPKNSEVTQDTIQDEQMLKDFIGAISGGICGFMGNRYVSRNGNSSIFGNSSSIREPASYISNSSSISNGFGKSLVLAIVIALAIAFVLVIAVVLVMASVLAIVLVVTPVLFMTLVLAIVKIKALASVKTLLKALVYGILMPITYMAMLSCKNCHKRVHLHRHNFE